MHDLSWLPTTHMAGYVTMYSAISSCSPSELENRLGFGRGGLAKGYAVYELIDGVSINDFIWADTTRYSGGAVDEPSITFKNSPGKIATVPRIDDERANLGRKLGYDEKKVDDALDKIMLASLKKLNQRHGSDRIVKIVPSPGVAQTYPDSKFNTIPQWELKQGAQKRFNLAAVVFDAQTEKRLSGAPWWYANQARHTNSSAVSDLAAGFRENGERFIKVLRAAGADVRVAATLRNKTRAWLMHYSHRLAHGQVRAIDIPASIDCDIIWDHGVEAQSRAAAKDMVKLFDIVYQPSLTSLHIKGLAIDMSIGWTGTIKVKDARGRVSELGAPQSGAKNTELHRIGATYGVKKLLSDAPHWSSTGH